MSVMYRGIVVSEDNGKYTVPTIKNGIKDKEHLKTFSFREEAYKYIDFSFDQVH